MGRFCYTKNNVNYAFLNPFSSLEALSLVGRKNPARIAGGVESVLRISRYRSLQLLFQRPLSIVYTTLLIQSQLDYSDIVWCNCGKTLFDRLQKLQNRAVRVLTCSRYDAYTNRLFKQLNWKDLSTQFQIQKALMVHKSLNDLVPGYLSSKLLNDVKRATP